MSNFIVVIYLCGFKQFDISLDTAGVGDECTVQELCMSRATNCI